MATSWEAIGLVLAVLATAATAPGPASAQANATVGLTLEQQAFLYEHGPIRYVFNDGFAPFTLVDDHGAVRGINRDLLRLMSVNLGLEFVTVQAPNFSTTLQAIVNGSADVAGNLGSTPERERTMAFTTPYLHTRVIAWAKEGHTLPPDMAGVKVGVVRNTSTNATVQKAWPLAHVVPVENLAPGLEALRNGSIDVFVGAEPTTAYIVQQSRYFDLVALAGPPLDDRAVSFAVPKNQTILLSILERGLATIPRDQRAAIFIKWTGRDLNEPVAPDPSVPLRTAGIAVIVLVLAAVVIGVPAWIVTLRNRVDEKTREARALNAELETRVAERTRDLETTNRELAAFTYTVSHDLRAPLRAMDGFSQAIIEDADARLDAKTREHATRVRGAAQRMASLIEDLLGLTRVSRNPLRVEDVDVTNMVDHIAGELGATTPSRHVTVHVEHGLHARGDPVLLRSVFQNLMDNAWKFTSSHDTATIDVGHVTTPDGDALFVRDDGVGFDPRFADKLFKPFERLHDASQFPGNGIGLATVRRIVERHGGKVWAEGGVGKGATFYVALPRAAAPHEPLPEARA